MAEYLIHYGDSGEPDTGLFDCEADSELDALKQFAKEFNVPVPANADIDQINGLLKQYGIIPGDIE